MRTISVAAGLVALAAAGMYALPALTADNKPAVGKSEPLGVGPHPQSR
jgi:hypothetical protein